MIRLPLRDPHNGRGPVCRRLLARQGDDARPPAVAHGTIRREAPQGTPASACRAMHRPMRRPSRWLVGPLLALLALGGGSAPRLPAQAPRAEAPARPPVADAPGSPR